MPAPSDLCRRARRSFLSVSMSSFRCVCSVSGILPYLSGTCPVCVVGDVMCADGRDVGCGSLTTAVENIERNRLCLSSGLIRRPLVVGGVLHKQVVKALFAL